MLRRVLGQERRVDVPFQVVDGDQRHPVDVRERFRDRTAHEQRADQPRPLGDGHPVQLPQSHARIGERLLDHRHDDFEVAARGELRNDTAVRRVDRVLRGDDAREHTAAIGEHRRRRLVT